ncbi:MAG: hypothetical protein LBJ14_03155 [Desulfarculales bacterium]|nr:hypothetical protein [Desulfarculales bacterium]
MRLLCKKIETFAAKALLGLVAAFCLGVLCWGELVMTAAAGPVRGRLEPVPEEQGSPPEQPLPAGGASGAARDGSIKFPAMSYQIYGRDFILPLNKDLGLSALPGYPGASPAWGLLRAAWPGSELLPLDHLSLTGGYEVFLAVMNSDLNGLSVVVPQDASFISAQQWGEIKGEALWEDLSSLHPGRDTGLGILYRDDYSLTAVSARLPQAESAGGADSGPKEEIPVPDSVPAVMVSSLSLVKGVPVVIGLSSERASDIPLMWNICHTLTLYLQMSNNPPEDGFFNPRPDSLVIGGRKLEINLPAGQCLLKAENLKVLTMLLQLETIGRGFFLPLLAYAPCEDLNAWLEDESESGLKFYGILGVHLENGQLKLRDEFSVDQFLKSLRQRQPEDRRLDPAQLDKLPRDQILGNLPEEAWKELGHFGVDSRAGYWAILIRGSSAAASFLRSSQAGVMGVGLVNNLEIANYLYMDLDEPDPYQTLLSTQRQLFGDFK